MLSVDAKKLILNIKLQTLVFLTVLQVCKYVHWLKIIKKSKI